jgi:hypothetical protein
VRLYVKKAILEALAGIRLPESEKRVLAKLATIRRVESGQILTAIGGRGSGVQLLVSGEAVAVRNDGTTSKISCVNGVPGVIGEVNALGVRSYQVADVTTTSEATLVVVQAQSLSTLSTDAPVVMSLIEEAKRVRTASLDEAKELFAQERAANEKALYDKLNTL